MMFLYIKALHLIGVVVWFAGLFYLGRLFVYHKEAEDYPEAERKVLKDQFATMERRLLRGITTPGMIVTIAFGGMLIGFIGMHGWLHLKLGFVALLMGYHMYCAVLRKQLLEDRCRWTGNQLRAFNEVPTILLVATIFVVVLKDSFSWIGFLATIGIVTLAIIAGIKLYANYRENQAKIAPTE